MRSIILHASWLLSFVAPALAEQATHCASNEVTYFNCTISGGKQVASLCGSGYDEEKKQSGYLQYRFGAPGSLEFLFPASTAQEANLDQYTYSATRSRNYDRYWLELQFENSGFVYGLRSVEKRREITVDYSASIVVRQLLEPCGVTCPKLQTPPNKIVKTYFCSNPKAGAKLHLAGVVRLMTTPGRSNANRF